jgi:hypothetical protein
MTDYLAVALTGFATGVGVIMAQEVRQFIKTYRLHRLPFDIAEDMAHDIHDIGVKRRRP